MRAICWIAASVVSLGCATTVAQTGMVGGVVGSFGGSPGGGSKQPYTATRKTTTVQKLFDGTTITRTTTEKEARDSQGRTFHQNQIAAAITMPHQQPPVFLINVIDPVERVTLSWSTQGKVATRFHMPEPLTQAQVQASMPTNAMPNMGRPATIEGTGTSGAGLVSGGTASGSRAAQLPGLRTLPDTSKFPKTHREQLDGKTIAGVYAKGTRVTTTYPVEYMGNDRPIVVVQETWTSPDLGMVVLSINDDPRTGVRTTELTDLDRNEPDPALFKVPEGYTIQEQHPNTQ